MTEIVMMPVISANVFIQCLSRVVSLGAIPQKTKNATNGFDSISASFKIYGVVLKCTQAIEYVT